MPKFVMNLTWDDVPHLSKEDKEQLLSSYSPHERDARSKGVPALGSGAIYPVVEDDIVCEAFKIPEHWPRTYAFDVGWKKNAVIWGAYDEKGDTWYLYSEYYRGYAEPAVHAEAIKSRGPWMRGIIDSASRSSSQADGQSLWDQYIKLGLDVSNANKSVDAGLLECLQRFSTGRLKIFKHLQNILAEFRVYRRDVNGRIVKKNDHLMDAMRYLIMTGYDTLELPPTEDNMEEERRHVPVGRNKYCGY